MFNKAISEFGLSLKNPFHQLEVPNEGLDTTNRIPFTIPELQAISEACRAKDDDVRQERRSQVPRPSSRSQRPTRHR